MPGRDPVSNDELRAHHLPARGASWREISRFVLSFDGYGAYPSVEALRDVYRSVKAGYEHGGLPEDLAQLCAALFFLQRRMVHRNEDLDDAEMNFVRAVVERIREIVLRR
jgi:hypothetical protein